MKYTCYGRPTVAWPSGVNRPTIGRWPVDDIISNTRRQTVARYLPSFARCSADCQPIISHGLRHIVRNFKKSMKLEPCNFGFYFSGPINDKSVWPWSMNIIWFCVSFCCNYALVLVCCNSDTIYTVPVGPHPVFSLYINAFDVSRAFMAGSTC